MLSPDYQQFTLDGAGRIATMGERMRLKLGAIRLPDLKGKSVLDVGCDYGFWCWLAAERGATRIVGLDRNRVVKGVGHVNLIEHNSQLTRGMPAMPPKLLPMSSKMSFYEIDLGKQWDEFLLKRAKFDVILCLSMYHHWYNNCGDHAPIWFWLWRHLKPEGVLIWEGPVGTDDPVVRKDVRAELQDGYCGARVVQAANRWFTFKDVRPALHEPTREVWTLSPPVDPWLRQYKAHVVSLHIGGATRAFEYADGRRMDEIERILGVRPMPGSLNLKIVHRGEADKGFLKDFSWDDRYYRAQILDVKDRLAGLDSEWAPRWCRFYPLTMNGVRAWAMRFEGDYCPEELVELISDVRLMDHVKSDEVTLCR